MSGLRLSAISGFIVIGVLSRLLPHPPNFTAMNAIALFGVMYLGSRWLSLATVLASVFLTDMVLGFHSTMSFVYLSFGLIVLLGSLFKEGISFHRLPLVSLVSSMLFFLVTNFGEWITGTLYPKTLNGLVLCYLAAIPFFCNQIVGDLCYGAVLYGYMYALQKYFSACVREMN